MDPDDRYVLYALGAILGFSILLWSLTLGAAYLLTKFAVGLIL